MQHFVSIRSGPDHIGSCRYAVDDQLELAAFEDYYERTASQRRTHLQGRPRRHHAWSRAAKGTMDLDVNDLAPDIVNQLRREPSLQMVQSPGTDYRYVGLNLRDPILRDLRVRQALAYAIDYEGIVQYLQTQGWLTTASGVLPPMSWAFEPDVVKYVHDPRASEAPAR